MISADNNPFGHDPGTLGQVFDWIDVRYGPITELSAIPLAPPEPRWWIYSCKLARTPLGAWSSRYHVGAAGASVDPDQALQRALGEALERYAGFAAASSGRNLFESPIDDKTIELPTCASFESCPTSFKVLPKLPVTHAHMQRLMDGKEVRVPASYVHLGYSRADEPQVTLPISTGLAFHKDPLNATWRGICESVERDAMMLMWWLRIRVPTIRLDVGPLPDRIESRVVRLIGVGLAASLFDITREALIPCVFCILKSNRYPYLTCGAACHEDPVEACAKALDEAVSIRVSLRWDKWNRELPSLKKFDWVRRLEDHMLLYAGWKDSPAFDFLYSKDNPSWSFEDFCQRTWWRAPKDDHKLEVLSKRLHSLGLTVLSTDVTVPEVRHFGCAIKVFVPEMVPLSEDNRARWLGTSRLLQASGHDEPQREMFNYYPHPFA